MTAEQTITRKEFPNGDVALDEGAGLIYRTAEASFSIELDLPKRASSDEPYGVDLVRTTEDDQGQTRQQRLPLAEYRSQMAAEEHVREAEKTLFEQGREGLNIEMNLVAAMPYETDKPLYLVGLYPPPMPDTDSATLNVLRIDGDRLDIAPVARGPVTEMAAIERRLFQAQTEGDTGVFLRAATAEAVRAHTLAPNTPLFADEGVELTAQPVPEVDTLHTPTEGEGQPSTPQPAEQVLPVTFGDDMTPFDDQGRYVPHHRDAAGTVHFFAVTPRPPDSPLPDTASHELRYFRAQQDAGGDVCHESQPIRPVYGPHPSPWPLPALNLHLENGDLDAAQAVARDVASDYDLTLPAFDPPGSGWHHHDAALVLATPQGVDDGYSVGVVDVYANQGNNRWAARCLPMGEFDTFDEALEYQQQTLLNRISEDRASALSPTGFENNPAIFERIARAEADAALTDLLEQNDGHLPLDYDGDHEPAWEPLTTKEWDAYRDHVRTIIDAVPGAASHWDNLPTTTPAYADDAFVLASQQPEPERSQPGEFSLADAIPTWQLEIVPAHDPEGEQLGYSAVCVVDFADLTETLSPDASERAQWLEVAQFQTEERANQFREDFMSLVGNDELGNITGPALAGVVADDLGMDGQWQTMDKQSLAQLKAGEWRVTHPAEEWEPRIEERASPTQAVEAVSLDIDR